MKISSNDVSQSIFVIISVWRCPFSFQVVSHLPCPFVRPRPCHVTSGSKPLRHLDPGPARSIIPSSPTSRYSLFLSPIFLPSLPFSRRLMKNRGEFLSRSHLAKNSWYLSGHLEAARTLGLRGNQPAYRSLAAHLAANLSTISRRRCRSLSLIHI